MKEDKTEKKLTDYDNRILPAILDFNNNLDAQFTSKANFLFGGSTIILFFILDKMLSNEFASLNLLVQVSWIILLIGSFLSMISSLMIVSPKLRIFSRKERVKEDVIYYKNIIRFFTREEYVEQMKKLPWDYEKICAAYANQVYSLSKSVIPYKSRMLKFSAWTLMIAIAAAIVFFTISKIVYSLSVYELFVY